MVGELMVDGSSPGVKVQAPFPLLKRQCVRTTAGPSDRGVCKRQRSAGGVELGMQSANFGISGETASVVRMRKRQKNAKEGRSKRQVAWSVGRHIGKRGDVGGILKDRMLYGAGGVVQLPGQVQAYVDVAG